MDPCLLLPASKQHKRSTQSSSKLRLLTYFMHAPQHTRAQIIRTDHNYDCKTKMLRYANKSQKLIFLRVQPKFPTFMLIGKLSTVIDLIKRAKVLQTMIAETQKSDVQNSQHMDSDARFLFHPYVCSSDQGKTLSHLENRNYYRLETQLSLYQYKFYEITRTKNISKIKRTICFYSDTSTNFGISYTITRHLDD